MTVADGDRVHGRSASLRAGIRASSRRDREQGSRSSPHASSRIRGVVLVHAGEDGTQSRRAARPAVIPDRWSPVLAYPADRGNFRRGAERAQRLGVLRQDRREFDAFTGTTIGDGRAAPAPCAVANNPACEEFDPAYLASGALTYVIQRLSRSGGASASLVALQATARPCSPFPPEQPRSTT